MPCTSHLASSRRTSLTKVMSSMSLLCHCVSRLESDSFADNLVVTNGMTFFVSFVLSVCLLSTSLPKTQVRTFTKEFYDQFHFNNS